VAWLMVGLILPGVLLTRALGVEDASGALPVSLAADWTVSAQGWLVPGESRTELTSPLRGWSATLELGRGVGEAFEARIRIRESGRPAAGVFRVNGDGFYLAENGRLVVLDECPLPSIPSRVQVFEADGREVWSGNLLAPAAPSLSSDGLTFVAGVKDGTCVLDLERLTETRLPAHDVFAAGPAGTWAALRLADPTASEGGTAEFSGHFGGATRTISLPDQPRRLALSRDGRSAYVIVRSPDRPGDATRHRAGEGGTLYRIDLLDGSIGELLQAPEGCRLRDVRVEGDLVLVGLRRQEGRRWSGVKLVLDPQGNILEQDRSAHSVDVAGSRGGEASGAPGVAPDVAPGPGASAAPGVEPSSWSERATIPWPLWPNSQHQVGNTYGEYQYYGGSPYPHPGFDVMGQAGQEAYAVAPGVVKAILTTSGSWHWRVAVGDQDIPGVSLGYLYAHIDEPTIPVDVGDPIVTGQWLGDLVSWPNDNFHHCHFTRIEDSGTTWDGNWLSVHNPHLDVNHSETAAPVFEPARGSDLLAFCRNETSTYLSPNSLNGQVDIIAHVSDRILTTWECTVQELRYSIYPLGMPGAPLVDNKLSVFFDMDLDTYGSGQIDAMMVDLLYKQDGTCRTQGDYGAREFYHILTNSNGDEVYDESDFQQCWDTSTLPDIQWVVKVRAIDAAGNARADSMVVRTVNGNTSGFEEVSELGPGVAHITSSPNPSAGEVTFSWNSPVAGEARLSIFDAGGRLVARPLPATPAGRTGQLLWNGRDLSGTPVPSGIYLYRWSMGGSERHGRIIVSR